jgi:hypothetical protein
MGHAFTLYGEKSGWSKKQSESQRAQRKREDTEDLVGGPVFEAEGCRAIPAVVRMSIVTVLTDRGFCRRVGWTPIEVF